MTRFLLALGSLALAASGGIASGSDAVRSTPIAGYSWPLLPGPDSVARDFNPPREPWLAGNRGVDLAGAPGEAVHASATGVVSFAGTVAGVGVVTITAGPLRTTYEPLHVLVSRGQHVLEGEVIGRLSMTGSHCLPHACLHWGLLRGSDYLDPMALLGLERVRLLPFE